MKTLLTISWRNIWRHPGRSGVLIGAIIAGMWAGILVSAWINGMIEQRVNRVIQEELTHLQVHHPDFLTEREPAMFIEPHEEIFSFLDEDQRVKSYTARTLVDGIVQSPQTASGVTISGIDPDRERQTTTFHENLVEGEYLNNDINNPVLIGRKLAERLNVETGNRLVLSFQDLESDLTSGAFVIAGIFHTGMPAYDERKVYVLSEDLSHMIAGEPVYHEIAVMLHDIDNSEQVVAELNEAFGTIKAENWIELSPELRLMTGAGESYMFYIMLVIMFALAFGILNTMLMAIFERMHEIGMLMAIGMSRVRVFVMIMIESVALTLTGAAAGMLVAHFTVQYFAKYGLDLTAFGGDTMAEWGYDAIVYPIVSMEEYITVTILVIVTAILSAVYPAIKAIRLDPASIVME
jgi:ABC-type lipoprotein release transport system permease subunit